MLGVQMMKVVLAVQKVCMRLLLARVCDRSSYVRDLLLGCVLRVLQLAGSWCHFVLLLRDLYPHSITQNAEILTELPWLFFTDSSRSS